jgi:hypothetical protein
MSASILAFLLRQEHLKYKWIQKYCDWENLVILLTNKLTWILISAHLRYEIRGEKHGKIYNSAGHLFWERQHERAEKA